MTPAPAVYLNLSDQMKFNIKEYSFVKVFNQKWRRNSMLVKEGGGSAGGRDRAKQIWNLLKLNQVNELKFNLLEFSSIFDDGKR